MSDAVQIALIVAAVQLVTHFFQKKQLNTIEKATNSMLSHTTEKKEAAEQKLEQTHGETIAELRAKLAERDNTIALLTELPKSK